MKESLSNRKTAFVSGSNRGIGFSIIENLASQGCNIFAHSRKKNSVFEKKINFLSKNYNVKIKPIYFDLADTKKLKLEISSLIKSQIAFDILVNSAGVIHGGLFQMTKIDTIKHIFDINYFSMLEVTQLICKTMVRKKRGSIINIASVAGIDLHEGNCAYGTSKAAMIAFSKTLSFEMREHGIRVNVIAPSLTKTEMANSREAEKEKSFLTLDKNPLNRMALPMEISNVVSFLALDMSSFITGEVIRVDGGNRF